MKRQIYADGRLLSGGRRTKANRLRLDAEQVCCLLGELRRLTRAEVEVHSAGGQGLEAALQYLQLVAQLLQGRIAHELHGLAQAPPGLLRAPRRARRRGLR